MLPSIVIAVLAIPVLAIVAIVMAASTRERLKRLEFKLANLEGQLAILTGAPAPVIPPPQPAAPVEAPAPVAATEPLESAAAAAAPPSPPKAKRSLEERFGTQWVVWAGGIALALGGFFLVRYSIEQGWFGPAARVLLAGLVAAALIAAGEWTRRNELKTGLAGLASAHIPSVLTAAGTAIAYADVYAAFALYGFLNAATAFLLLAVVALGTLAAALLHGPALAGLGLVGAYVTPLIVSTEEPSYWALYLYLAVVTAAAFALARIRHWRWLAVTAIVASALWTLPGIGDIAAVAPHAFHVAAGFVLSALLIVSGLLFGPDSEKGEIDAVSSGALAAYLLASTLLVLATGHDTLALLLFVVLVAATVAIAWRTDSSIASVPVAALLVALVFAQWAFDFDLHQLDILAGAVPDSAWRPDEFLFGAPLMLGGAFAALFGISGFLAQGRSTRPFIAILWSACAVAAPIAILIALYYRIAGFDRSLPFATAALVLAAIYAFATEALAKRPPRPGQAASGAIFATGAIAALALALSLALEKGWLTVALALMVPGIAWVAEQRAWLALRWLAAAMTVAVLGRIAWDPRIVGDDIGTTPVFNWLLYGYGVPALAFWFAGRKLRQRTDDVPSRIVDAAAILFTVLLIVFQVRHYVWAGAPYDADGVLAETALDVTLLLAVLIGLERVREKSGSVVHDWGARILAAGLLYTALFGLGVAANPLFTDEAVGPPVFNLILLGYGLPALLAAILAYVTRNTRPKWYSATAAAAALALALAYLSLEIRTLYHGPILSVGATSDAEQYTYSAVWLAFGVALLAAGIWLKSLPLRAASAAVVVLTVLKVFLFDMSDLTGIYRALSFLGLGAVLIGIGWFYQRLLFPRPTGADEAPSE
ncbi:MAG: DUF2339 domain-containing protein [Methyloceanibacter sp.]|uniref:DUF2339 domain-containing protein n=1 Tax=Methyloceanibacter sp. TaxID=1965321 RepID=UPI003D6D835A